jgi:hypothetical protein
MGDSRPKKEVERKSIAELIEDGIQSFARRPKKPATYAEFLRLVELQKELGRAQPKEIVITWVEPRETESSET